MSSSWSSLAVAIVLASMPSLALAQTIAAPPALSVERVATLPALAALPASSLQSQATTEFTINWNVGGQSANLTTGAPGDIFQIVNSRTALGPMVLERAPELSEDRLIVVAATEQGEVGWQMLPDPSLIRAELPDANGNLTGQVLRRTQTSLLVTVPQTPQPITQLRVYRPRWTGTAFVLDPVGAIALPNPPR